MPLDMSGPLYFSFDRVADIYDQTRGLPPDAEVAMAERLARLLQAGAHVLEVGIGSGRIAVPLAAQGVPVTGVDISPRMLERLRRRNPGVGAVLAEAAALPFRSNAFDAALFVHILHLVPDLSRTLAETVRCVRPGGMFIACHTRPERNAIQEAEVEVHELIVKLLGRAPRRRSNVNAEQALREALGPGAKVEQMTLATWTETQTGRHEVDELANRVHSATWEIPDDVLAVAVPRATEIYERRCGSLDREFETAMQMVAIVVRAT